MATTHRLTRYFLEFIIKKRYKTYGVYHYIDPPGISSMPGYEYYPPTTPETASQVIFEGFQNVFEGQTIERFDAPLGWTKTSTWRDDDPATVHNFSFTEQFAYTRDVYEGVEYTFTAEAHWEEWYTLYYLYEKSIPLAPGILPLLLPLFLIVSAISSCGINITKTTATGRRRKS